MPLFSKTFAMDTETDSVEGYEEPRTVLMQMCPVDAVSEKDVVLLTGLDVFDQFLDKMEETKHNMDCHVFNLDYEWSRMEQTVLSGYSWSEERKLPKGTFHVVGDDRMIYEVRICNQHGKVLKITDDWQRSKGSMADVAGDIFGEHPEWWPEGVTAEDVKIEVSKDKYNNGWSAEGHEDHELMVSYAIRDAYSQAMIARYQIENGRADYLTGSSAGLGACIIRKYRKDGYNVPHYKKLKWAKEEFNKVYPPLNREMQDIVERSIVGGFVYGDPGVHRGVHTHIDYKSSYPQFYAHEDMFIGRVSVIKEGDKRWDQIVNNPKLFRWYVVSFEFDGLTDAGMPLITGKECDWPGDKLPPNCYNHKMRSGKVNKKLMTEDYLEELRKHLVIVGEVKKHEMWFAKRINGGFKDFIEEEYFLKEVYKAAGLKAESKIHKDNMNGGVHGKTITKTHRKSVTYKDGYKDTVDVVNDPEYCSLIGFTGMMQRRCALVRDCRRIQEKFGRVVLMCDTDSMVVSLPEEEVRAFFGEEIANEEVCDGMTVKQMVKKLMSEGKDWMAEMRQYKDAICGELGKFEVEINKETGLAMFEGFDCWGLKRYLERENGAYRKSAFAGMSDEAVCDWSENKGQRILMDAPVDGSVFTWSQTGSRKGSYGKMIREGTKSARMEDIWYTPVEQMPKKAGMLLGKAVERIEMISMMNTDEYWADD